MPDLHQAQDGQRLVDLVTTSLDDDKAIDVVTIDLAGKSSISDHMVIATGTSNRQVVAMAEHLVEKLKAVGVKGVAVEGQATGDWVLIDAGDVIAHLFRPEVREFYALEKMWGGEPEARTARTVRVGSSNSGESDRRAVG